MRKKWMAKRDLAIDLAEKGFGYGSIAKLIGAPATLVRKWLYTYRALGKEALFVETKNSYSQQTKLDAVDAVLSGRMGKVEAMREFGIKSISSIELWCRQFREGGADALAPKKRGRPKAEDRVFASREEELEERVRELELEVEILKRFNALAEEIEHARRIR